MSTLTLIFVLLHMICWAGTFGIWIAAARTTEPNKGLFHTAAAAPVFGILALGTASAAGWDLNHMVYGIKLVIAILVAVFSFLAVKKQANTSPAIWYAIPVGLVINMILTLFFA